MDNVAFRLSRVAVLARLVLLAAVAVACGGKSTSHAIGVADSVQLCFSGWVEEEAGRRKEPQLACEVFAGSNEVQRFERMIAEEPQPFYKCGETGTMRFFTRDRQLIRDVAFNLSSSCRHAIWLEGDSLVSRALADEGSAWLTRRYEQVVPIDARK